MRPSRSRTDRADPASFRIAKLDSATQGKLNWRWSSPDLSAGFINRFWVGHALHSCGKTPVSVSGYRFSDTVSHLKSDAPLGAEGSEIHFFRSLFSPAVQGLKRLRASGPEKTPQGNTREMPTETSPDQFVTVRGRCDHRHLCSRFLCFPLGAWTGAVLSRMVHRHAESMGADFYCLQASISF